MAEPSPSSDFVNQGLPVLAEAAAELNHPLLDPLVVDGSDGLSPDELSILAVFANPDLRSVRAARGLVGAQLVGAGVLPNPQLSGSYDVPSPDSGTAVSANSIGAALDLFGFLTRGSLKTAARIQLEAATLDVAWQEWIVAHRVRSVAFHVLIAERRAELAMRHERDLAEVDRVLSAAVARGLSTQVERSAAAVALGVARASRIGADAEIEQTRIELNRLLGLDPTTELTIQEAQVPLDLGTVTPATGDAASFSEAVLGFASDSLVQRVTSSRLDLAALRLGYASQEARVRAAYLGRFPKITIGFNRARDTGGLLTRGLGVGLNFPIFDRNQGPIAIENATRELLRAEHAARLVDARAEVATLLDQASSSRSILANARDAAGAQAQLVDLYGRALRDGNADVLSYYAARTALIQSELDVLFELSNLVSVAVGLETSIGQIIPALHP